MSEQKGKYDTADTVENVRLIVAKLLKAATKIGIQIDQLDDLLPDAFTEYFGDGMDELQDAILSLCGVPEERTPFELLGISTEGFYESQIEYGFCRDYVDEKVWDLRQENPEEFDFAAFLDKLQSGDL